LGRILERNFGKPLSETTFGDRLSSCSEQLSIINKFGNGFREELCGAGLETSFGSRSNFEQQLHGDHLWGVALERNFGEQFSGAALENSFGEHFGKQV
jgi:hypothetical protein